MESHWNATLKYLNLQRVGSVFKGLFLTFVKIHIHKLLVRLNSSTGNAAKDLGGTTTNSCLWRACLPKHPEEGREHWSVGWIIKNIAKNKPHHKAKCEEYTSVPNTPWAMLQEGPGCTFYTSAMHSYKQALLKNKQKEPYYYFSICKIALASHRKEAFPVYSSA